MRRGLIKTDSPCMAEGGKGYMLIRSCISRGGSDRLDSNSSAPSLSADFNK